jgi:hypothetical protein
MAAHQTHPVALAYLNVCRILMMVINILTHSKRKPGPLNELICNFFNLCSYSGPQTHKPTSSLVDSSEEGPAGRGLFDPEAKDPEHSMAQTAVAWELTALQVISFTKSFVTLPGTD